MCLRTASVEWNLPGKYGPHRELFFFVIQKEPVTIARNGETFSPFINADICIPGFSADVLEEVCAPRLALKWRKEEEMERDF